MEFHLEISLFLMLVHDGSPSSDPSTPVTPTQNANGSKAPHYTQLPQFRIKKIMKEDPTVGVVSADSVLCVAVATEIFLEYFVQHAFQYAKRDKRRMITYKDVGKFGITLGITLGINLELL
jgi:histone H3/H4